MIVQCSLVESDGIAVLRNTSW